MTLEDPNPAGIIWGAVEIGKAIGKSKRQVFHLLETGQLHGAVKKGGRWAITVRALMANFEAADIVRTEIDRLSREGCKALLARCE